MPNKIAIFLLTLFCAVSVYSQVKTELVKPFSIGETHVIKSTVLNEDRALNIYLPNGYDKSKKYPVIYLLDGSMDEDFIHIVGLVQFFRLQMKMPDFIVVGIGNVDRRRDFTFPTSLKDLKSKYP